MSQVVIIKNTDPTWESYYNNSTPHQMSALLREMEKAKHDHLREAAKMKTLQFLAESQHAAQRRKHQDQIVSRSIFLMLI